MDDVVVVRMHTESGLLDRIRSSELSLADAGAQTLAFLREHVPEARTVPLCGNSIGTDRRFLARYLPEIEDHLHYRSVDVSTIKELAQALDARAAEGRADRRSARTGPSTTSGSRSRSCATTARRCSRTSASRQPAAPPADRTPQPSPPPSAGTRRGTARAAAGTPTAVSGPKRPDLARHPPDLGGDHGVEGRGGGDAPLPEQGPHRARPLACTSSVSQATTSRVVLRRDRADPGGQVLGEALDQLPEPERVHPERHVVAAGHHVHRQVVRPGTRRRGRRHRPRSPSRPRAHPRPRGPRVDRPAPARRHLAGPGGARAAWRRRSPRRPRR